MQELWIKWATSSEFGTYRLCEQRTFRRACESAQSRQNLRCLLFMQELWIKWATSSEFGTYRLCEQRTFRRGSGETARMRRLAWTFAARIGDKYQIRLTRSNCCRTRIYPYKLLKLSPLMTKATEWHVHPWRLRSAWAYQFLHCALSR